MNVDAAHLSSLFEYATEGIILTNGAGEIMLINPAAQRMFGYKGEELIGEVIERLIPERFAVKHHELRDKFYNKPSHRMMGAGRDLYARKKDGSEMPVEVSLSFYKRNEELFVIVFIVDITGRKEIEKNLLSQQAELETMALDMRKLNSELEAKVEERTVVLTEALERLEISQKDLSEALDKEKQLNEIKSSFVSLASHEFRTPLSTILSSAVLLEKYTKTEDQDKREKHVNKIKDSVKHLNDLLEDFLSLGKLNEGKVETNNEYFFLQDFLDELAEEMRPILKTGQQIIIDNKITEEIYSDKKLLRNMLINLVSNASKFSEPNTRVLITGFSDVSKHCIQVSDEGIGIPEEDLANLFTSFFRSKNAANIQGTGLGLHIVQRYAGLIGAKINIQSQLGLGTRVTIEILHPEI